MPTPFHRPSLLASATRPVAALLLATFTACSGGGGASDSSNPTGRLLVNSPLVTNGARSTRLQIGLDSQNPRPVIVQFDLVADPSQLRFQGDAQARTTLQTVEVGRPANGKIRVVCGDASRSEPGGLPNGPLVDIPLVISAPASMTGDLPVRIENIVASTADGTGLALEIPGAQAVIRVR